MGRAQRPLRWMSGSADLLGDHLEPGKGGWAEIGRECDVGGVAAGRHENAADARHVVARVERIPAPGGIGLEPGREIHRLRARRHTDTAPLARATWSCAV